jgi:hypothetical protein
MHPMNRLGFVSAGLLIASVFIALPGTAVAGDCVPTGRAYAGANSAPAKLNCDGEQDPPPERRQPATKKSGKAAKPACVWVPEPTYQQGAGQKADGAGGHWYRKFCSFGDYLTLADLEREMGTWDAMDMRKSNMLRRAGLEIRWFTAPPPVPRPTPDQVMASIVDSLQIPDTFIAVNPVATKQVVGIPTWVWLTDEKGQFVPDRYGQKSKTIAIEGYQLQWQIVPQLILTPGDTGPEQTCTGAGVPWSASAEGDPTACTVIYNRSGQYTLAANVGYKLAGKLDRPGNNFAAGNVWVGPTAESWTPN